MSPTAVETLTRISKQNCVIHNLGEYFQHQQIGDSSLDMRILHQRKVIKFYCLKI